MALDSEGRTILLRRSCGPTPGLSVRTIARREHGGSQMPAELPTIASCPHCGAILLRTPRVLVHPMSGERDKIQRTLGRFWFVHAHTRFDGRIHRCPGRERADHAAEEALRRLAPTQSEP